MTEGEGHFFNLIEEKTSNWEHFFCQFFTREWSLNKVDSIC
jgi:hypothetical protein